MNKRRITAATYGIGKYTEDSGCLQLRPLQMHRTLQLSVSGREEEESKCRSP